MISKIKDYGHDGHKEVQTPVPSAMAAPVAVGLPLPIERTNAITTSTVRRVIVPTITILLVSESTFE